MPTTTALGHAAESRALEYLKARGLKLVQRNFRCKAGEIDLIMRDGNLVCFVEVRMRQSKRHLSGAESITHSKIRKLIRAAGVYLQVSGIPVDAEYRFDVVSIGEDIEWIAGAFTAEGY